MTPISALMARAILRATLARLRDRLRDRACRMAEGHDAAT